MIRTLIAISAFAAIAGAANAADLRVSLVGKDSATIRTEVSQAAKLACQDVSVSDYAPCVTETYRNAMDQVIKVKNSK
ncbi:MAG: hypothetical protein JWO72_3350 [Caulobacteraceae bacterium]|nr:hypothetical protein [Caulobacteraceae bacterium]